MVNQKLLNGGALNGAGLATWVKSATVAAALTLTMTAADGTRVKAGVAAPLAGATAQATPIRIKPGTVTTPLARGQGYLLTSVVYGGTASLTARSLSLAACERFVHATVEGVGTVDGFAVAESEIGEAAFPGAITGAATPSRIRPGASQISAAVTATPAGAVFGQSPSLTAGATSRVEASARRSGENYTRHDGYVEDVLASATAAIAVSYLERTLTLTETTHLTADAFRIRPGDGVMAAAMTASVEYRGVALLNVPLQGQASGSVTPLRVRPGQASRSAVASSSQTVARTNQAATATTRAAMTGVETVVVVRGGRATAVLADALGTATAIRHLPGQAAATGAIAATSLVLARSNPSLVFGAVQARAAVGAVDLGCYVPLTGSATAGPLVYGQQQRGAVSAMAEVIAAPLAYAQQQRGTAATSALVSAQASAVRVVASEADATAGAVGYANGKARIDLNAPASRSMIVPYEPRGLIVPAEDRTLVVPA